MKQYQVCDIKSSKGDSKDESKEKTRDWSKKEMERRMANKHLNYDFTRTRLNFEVVNGEIKEVDKKKTFDQSVRETLMANGIPHPDDSKSHVRKDAKKPEKQIRNIAANIILGGSRETMLRIAFGDQTVNLTKGADNSHIRSSEDIKQFALDNYNWMVSRGWLVARMVGHLDETNPHFHATVIPTATIKGKTRISYREVFGGSREEASAKYKAILDDYYEKVGKKWGLERGEPISETGNRHRSTRDYNNDLDRENFRLERENESLKEENGSLKVQNGEIREDNDRLRRRNRESREQLEVLSKAIDDVSGEMMKHTKAMKSLTTMIENKMAERNDAIQSLQTAQEQRDSGKISTEEYENIASDTMAKVEQFDKFVSEKVKTLANVSTELVEKKSELKAIKEESADLIKEASEAREYKKRESGMFGIWERFQKDKATKDAVNVLVDTAKRLGAISENGNPDLALVASQLLKFVQEEYPQKLNDAKKAGRRSAIKDISVASGRNWKPENMPTPEQLGKWYKQHYDNTQRLKNFEKLNGKIEDASMKIKNLSAEKEELQNRVNSSAKRESRIWKEVYRIWPSAENAVKSIIDRTNTNQRAFTSEQARTVWNAIKDADEKERPEYAEDLMRYAKESFFNDHSIPKGWIEETAEEVLAIASTGFTAVSVLFNQPMVSGGGGGGGNNDLPKKKREDDDRYASIIGGFRKKGRAKAR